MSNSLTIEFDRPDRTYKPGEIVTGRILLETDRGDRCKGIVVRRYWRTHGKGNKDGQEPHEYHLHWGALPPGRHHEFSFEFATPEGPFTYHGHLLNVDHYVEVQVDIPWARDPRESEEFILLPGPVTRAPPFSLVEASEKGTVRVGRGCRGGLGLFLIFLGLVTLPPGILFMGIGTLLLFPLLKNYLAGDRLGRVSSFLDPTTAVPGQAVDASIRVEPKKPVQINSASVELRAREICVSGSGTSKTTHRHTVFSKAWPISGPGEVVAGTSTVLTAAAPIPEDAGYSFASPNNKLLWEAILRIDIPAWPDWEKVYPLVVWPPVGEIEVGPDLREVTVGHADPVPVPPSVTQDPGTEEPHQADAVLPDRPTGDIWPERAGVVDPEPGLEVIPPVEEELPPPEAPSEHEPRIRSEPVIEPDVAPDSPPVPSPKVPAFAAIVQAILEVDVFRGERDRHIKDLLGTGCRFPLEVDRVERTFAMYSDAEYRHGRTAYGKVADTDVQVSVWFPEARNEEVEALKEGDRVEVTGTVADWDRLRNSPRIKAD